MQYFFTIKEGKIIESIPKGASIRVITAPTENEKSQIIKQLEVDSFDFDAALDPDEVSRVEFEPGYTTVIWSIPHTGSFDLHAKFDVTPVGFFIQKKSLILIMAGGEIPFDNKIFDGVKTVYDVLLRYFFYSAKQFSYHLKAIKQAKAKLEKKLSHSMENKYFLQMFDMSESLIYYIDSIEANGAVLTKLLGKTTKQTREVLKLTQTQIDFLEDVIQENTQIARQANIYSSILSGLMDARGNIINNNMNVLLKNLTIINVVFLPLNLLASMGGMSEFTLITDHYNVSWQAAYFWFSVAMFMLGWFTWLMLNKKMLRHPQGE